MHHHRCYFFLFVFLRITGTLATLDSANIFLLARFAFVSLVLTNLTEVRGGVFQ